MIHKTGDMRTPVPVGKAHNTNPYPVIGSDDVSITSGAERIGSEIKARRSNGTFPDKVAA